MDEAGLSKAVTRALRRHLDQRRAELPAAILRAAGEGRRSVRTAFVQGLLDRLDTELAGGDRLETEAWIREVAGLDRRGDEGIVALSLAIIGASYAGEHPDGHIVARYLAIRGKQLDRALEDGLARRDAQPYGGRVDLDELVESLLASLEARDLATCDHSRAVGMWSARIAAEMGMGPEQQRFAGLCGTLHDIGKLTTPKAILLKPATLDDDEWTTMREHSAAGARILDRLPSLRECAPVVRAHHERIDGTGYPDGLAGSSIPPAARIIAVADAFHAIISDRPYRPASPAKRALQLLTEEKGERWDSAAVEAMHALIARPVERPAIRRAAVGSTNPLV